MGTPAGTMQRAREFVAVAALAVTLAAVMTWPLVSDIGRIGRTRDVDADGQFSIWNVAWVARTIVADPVHLFDANIYYPHRRTLAYSEANLVEGVLAVPVYWLTKNPWAALNVVMLFAFASGYAGAYLLMRWVCGDRRAAAVAAILYAFCPYTFAHLSHIQLLMTGGIPFALLLFHRIAEGPTVRRGAWLGLAVAVEALACAYYGMFAGLSVAYAATVVALRRVVAKPASAGSAVSSARYWRAIATAAIVSVVVVAPVFFVFTEVRAETGFARTIDDAARWAANPQSYLASAAHAHGWLLAYANSRFERWTEVLFPGVSAVLLGAAGVVVAARAPASDNRVREAAVLYGTLAVLAFWASLGPSAGLYKLLFHLPAFAFLRAPSRIGIVVVLCLAVLASVTIARALRAVPARWQGALAGAVGVAAILDLLVAPIPLYRAPALPRPYAVLAKMPRAVVAEFPFYGERIAYPLHAQYMLFSTSHWMPLVNGYSDVIPEDFRPTATILDSFPSRHSFDVLARHRVRYIGIHWDMFVNRQNEIRARLQPFLSNLRPIASDDRMTLYEIVTFP